MFLLLDSDNGWFPKRHKVNFTFFWMCLTVNLLSFTRFEHFMLLRFCTLNCFRNLSVIQNLFDLWHMFVSFFQYLRVLHRRTLSWSDGTKTFRGVGFPHSYVSIVWATQDEFGIHAVFYGKDVLHTFGMINFSGMTLMCTEDAHGSVIGTSNDFSPRWRVVDIKPTRNYQNTVINWSNEKINIFLWEENHQAYSLTLQRHGLLKRSWPYPSFSYQMYIDCGLHSQRWNWMLPLDSKPKHLISWPAPTLTGVIYIGYHKGWQFDPYHMKQGRKSPFD